MNQNYENIFQHYSKILRIRINITQINCLYSSKHIWLRYCIIKSIKYHLKNRASIPSKVMPYNLLQLNIWHTWNLFDNYFLPISSHLQTKFYFCKCFHISKSEAYVIEYIFEVLVTNTVINFFRKKFALFLRKIMLRFDFS